MKGESGGAGGAPKEGGGGSRRRSLETGARPTLHFFLHSGETLDFRPRLSTIQTPGFES